MARFRVRFGFETGLEKKRAGVGQGAARPAKIAVSVRDAFDGFPGPAAWEIQPARARQPERR